jgi:hypothetical protein
MGGSTEKSVFVATLNTNQNIINGKVIEEALTAMAPEEGYDIVSLALQEFNRTLFSYVCLPPWYSAAINAILPERLRRLVDIVGRTYSLIISSLPEGFDLLLYPSSKRMDSALARSTSEIDDVLSRYHKSRYEKFYNYLGPTAVVIWIKSKQDQRVTIEPGAMPVGHLNLLPNKGGVSVKVIIERLDTGASESFILVSCHLNAHEGRFKRREKDIKTIMMNTPIIGKSDLSLLSLYEGPVICAGDLNYRLKMNRKLFDQKMNEIASLNELLEYDELQDSLLLSELCFKEAEVSFSPTYKRKYGHGSGLLQDYTTAKRLPSWCDRILYNSGRDSSVKVSQYRSKLVGAKFDHDMVYASLRLIPKQEQNSVPKQAKVSSKKHLIRTLLFHTVSVIIWTSCVITGIGLLFQSVKLRSFLFQQ